MKLTADILGYVATVLFVIATQFPKKSHILICYALANLSTAASVIFLLGRVSSAALLSLVGFMHTSLNLYHHCKHQQPGKPEQIVVILVYLVSGLLGVRQWLDVLPIIGSMFFVWSVLQTDEQKIRYILLGNAFFNLIYYIAIGSTVALAEFLADISIITSIFRYRKAKRTDSEQGGT